MGMLTVNTLTLLLIVNKCIYEHIQTFKRGGGFCQRVDQNLLSFILSYVVNEAEQLLCSSTYSQFSLRLANKLTLVNTTVYERLRAELVFYHSGVLINCFYWLFIRFYYKYSNNIQQ